MNCEMEVCRVCLSNAPDRDIYQLKTTKKEGPMSPSEIMEFCLGILITEDSKITRKLCTKCYKKILAFYKFKALALRNDATLRTIANEHDDTLITIPNEHVKSEVLDDEEEVFFGPSIQEMDSLDDSSLGLRPSTGLEDSPDECVDRFSHVKVEFESIFQSDNDTHKEVKSEDELEIRESSENKCDATEPTTDCVSEGLATKDHKNKQKVARKGRTKKPRTVKTRVPSEPKQKKSHSKSQKRLEVCEECGKAVKNLKEHLMSHKSPQEKRHIPCKDPKCDKKFSTPGGRYRHFRTKHLGIHDHCDICNKDVSQLAWHMYTTHQQDKLPYACVECGKRFVSQSALEVHVTIHTADRPHACDQCGKTFRLKYTLNNHVRQVHLKEKSYVCSFCSKQFFKKINLDVHMRTHTKEKPFKCEQCGARFAVSKTLKNHQLSHGGKNHHCAVCSLSFARLTNLQTHMLCHTNEKRHACRYCGVAFKRTDHRNRHERTAHLKHLAPDSQKGRVESGLEVGESGFDGS